MAFELVERRPQAARYNVTKLLLLGLVFHLVFIGSVFDCYFTSPVVNGMKSYGAQNKEKLENVAKRLVLIVGDGLRADLLFNVNAFPNVPDSPSIVAPYLREIVEKRGAFGISHTRVPTESRPGHVAIIGGMYEDVSAVTKGWKTNPVDFDSVFNQSTKTFSFGSPDILPMFAKGASPGKVEMWSYDEDEEDFTKDATALDVWVLDQMKELFRNATSNPTLDSELRSDKVVFFLHLLGLDTTGHSYRPHSKEYMENIRVVDNVVKETEKLIHEFFGDDRTSFIFTADHGMSVIGNHGDGHPDNTRTPLIAWGAKVRGPLPDTTHSSHDAYSTPWELDHLVRRDVEQADIASLMAALIGINWPVNSVGILPDVDSMRPGYLNASEEELANLALINAQAILEQYRVKHDLKKAHSLFYTSYNPLSQLTTIKDAPQIKTIHNLIGRKQWNESRRASAQLLQQTIAGLHYLQTYDRFLIRGFVTAAYLGWAAYASLYILRPLDGTTGAERSGIQSIMTAMSWMVAAGFWILFAVQKSPWTFYVYIAFPCYFWQQVVTQTLAGASNSRLSLRTLYQGAMVVVALLSMVAGYTHRSVWSIGFALIGIVWPTYTGAWSKNSVITGAWAASCLSTAVFPLLSVDKNESLLTIMVGGIVLIAMGGVCAPKALQNVNDRAECTKLGNLFKFQQGLIFVTMAITTFSVWSLRAKQGLPALNQWAGWIVLLISSLIPFVSNVKGHTGYTKILMYFLGFGPCFVILSISVEGLFFVSYSATLVTWIQMESLARQAKSIEGKTPPKSSAVYQFQGDDLRVALFFLFFVQVGFFGTGNVASISSFYLAPVYRLIPIFNPFFMTALLLFKIIAPYIMLSVTHALLNDVLYLPPFSLLLVALTLTDGMTLSFFYRVQDTGSWLEIGQSISFFCITSLLLLWSAGICAAGEYLINGLRKRDGLDEGETCRYCEVSELGEQAHSSSPLEDV